MTRILQIDCAAALIGEIRGMLQVQSKVLVLAHLRPDIGDALIGPTAAADPSPAVLVRTARVQGNVLCHRIAGVV